MILSIIQARYSSSRLPGKVLKPILGKPMLLRQIERINRAKRIDRLVVATSVDKSDNEIENICRINNIVCFRGSLDDVLDRFYQAALQYNPEHIVRLTGDCPLADPEVIDAIIKMHVEGGYDYTSNCIKMTFPDGLDTEVFTFKALRVAWEEACLPSHREHVTQFFHKNPERYQLGSYTNNVDLSHLRWTVDEELDFILVTKIYEALYPEKSDFTTEDILKLLDEKPELKTINSAYKCNEGLAKSLRADEDYLKTLKRSKG
jgi:spore coat polysaccharide biosynthesis protein SpsF